jgi:hypothetical protein
VNISEVLLNNFLEYYKESLFEKNLKFAEQYRNFIKKFVSDFDNDFNNLEVKSLFSLSEEETKLVRMRYGVYCGGKCFTLQRISEELGVKYPKNIINKFERKIFEDLDQKLKAYSFFLENSDNNDGFDNKSLFEDDSSEDDLFLKRCDLLKIQHSILQRKAKINKLLKEIKDDEAKEAELLLEIEELLSKQSNRKK